MTILCIETSTSVCSAALWQDGVVLQQLISREGGNHAKLLPAYIEQLLHQAIDAVAISSGPGSYTGLRIGVSTAKGLCYGLNVPLVAVPTLDVLCAAAIANDPQLKAGKAALCPMIDARRMEVYTALYNNGMERQGEVQAAIIDPQFRPADEFWYFGDGAAKCQAVLPQPECHYLPDIVPEAQYMGELAAQRLRAGDGMTGSDLAYFEPFYLKEFIAAQSHVKGLK